MKDLKAAYKTIEADHFAPKMEISFIDGDSRQTFQYEKVTWNIGGEEKGLRYGENPGQEAALYKLVNGNLVLGDVEMIQAGRYLASVPELLQSGKHPGKLQAEVCSPAGTTIAGVRTLEQRGFRAAAMDAVIAAYERTKELAGD